MFRHRCDVQVTFLFAALCWPVVHSPPVQAQPTEVVERAAAELLPPSTVVYIELPDPSRLLTTVLDHPLRPRVEALSAVRAAQEKKEYLDLKAVVAIVESQLEMPWRKLLDQAAGSGITVAFDAPTRGLAVLAKGKDATTSGKLRDRLMQLARQDAANKGLPDPVKLGDYRGIAAVEVGKAKVATFDRWVLVTSQDQLGKEILDRWLDRPAQSLASDPRYQQACVSRRVPSTLFGYVNTAVMREAGVAPELFRGQADNPVGELLLGGVLSTLTHTPYITLSSDADATGVRLTLSAPLDRAWAGDAREYFFGPEGRGSAPAPLLSDDVLFTLSAYRDISAMWLRAGDLFNEKTNEELAKADSTLTTLFAGKDFGEDILGALRPEVQLVVTPQTFGKDQPIPAVKLPAFALVADLRDPERMQPELRRTFQSLIGFLNVVGAMNGQPQLDQSLETTPTGQLVTGRYLPNTGAKDPLGLKINYNFSPTLAFSGGRFVLASTEQLARQLVFSPVPVSATNPAATNPAGRVINTAATFRFAPLRELLAENRGQLVAQNMLNEGHTKEEAERIIQELLELVSWFDRARLQLDSTERQLQLSLGIEVR